VRGVGSDQDAAGESGHPIIRSAEPGEDWSWCYVDEVAFTIPPR